MTAPLPPGATREIISGDFFTSAYRVTGSINVGHAGLARLLNDTTTSLVEIQDAYVSRADQPGKILTRFLVGRIAKARLELALVNRREDVGPLGVARSTSVTSVEYPVLAATSSFEVRGTLEQPGRLDVAALLFEGSGKFFLLHRATIIALPAPDVQFTAPAVLVNRARVELLCAQSEEF